ncbi:TlpA disulfide reductase family protein [Pedobacter rhodius]|uniref:TlpA disulfide reductase family protein n=1 Tax=Pedobacter rhodius TaxID=3004098 RepID=A0ABT4L155_9SPHI|nr:TlpA disulfide reductase family protein [Pedobacter sp. SJ11]MCZ4224864.1 TlpA disulfide reductase family protein [Pedobacter sp. SJ11]
MKILISLLTILLPFILRAQVNNNYTIEGKTSNPATFIVQYTLDGKAFKNTAEVKNGEIKLSGSVDGKLQATLMITPSETGNAKDTPMGTMVHFWLEPGNIKVDNLDSIQKGIQFSGTILNDETNELSRAKMALAVLPQGKQQDDAIKALVVKFIRAHPGSLVSFTELNYTLSRGIPDLALVEPLFNSLSADIKSSPMGLEYQKKLIKWRTVDIESMAPEFTQPDQFGKTIKLSDYKGRYVLIDFWASWCHPCRDENPNLVKQYNLYKNRNFTILSVSLDERKEDWLKAIKEDKLPWKQVSDLKRNNEAKVKYGVQSIPDNFLVDPDGKIIAKNLRGEELNKKLAEVLGKGH